MFRLKLKSSFCNNWPEIRITANGATLWQDFVVEEKTLDLDFELIEQNSIRIEYLNKRSGPEIWDTAIDENGKITSDQHCVISDIHIANSRCDFILGVLDYNHASGFVEKNVWGFMSQIGHFEITFPKDVYTWIISNRNKQFIEHYKSKTEYDQESSLSYFENYALHNAQDLQPYLENIDKLLEELDDKNISN